MALLLSLHNALLFTGTVCIATLFCFSGTCAHCISLVQFWHSRLVDSLGDLLCLGYVLRRLVSQGRAPPIVLFFGFWIKDALSCVLLLDNVLMLINGKRATSHSLFDELGTELDRIMIVRQARYRWLP